MEAHRGENEMKYTADERKERFLFINRNGSTMEIIDGDGEKLFKIMINSLVPMGDEDGLMVILWKEVGYNNGGHCHHFARITNIEVDDSLDDKHDGEQWLIIDMEDEEGRKYHVEMLDDVTNFNECEKWKVWNKYKAKNAELFKRIDAAIIG